MVRRDETTLGPVSLARVEQWIRSGTMPRSAEMGLVGHDEWLPLERVLPAVKPAVQVARITAPRTPMGRTALVDPELDGAPTLRMARVTYGEPRPHQVAPEVTALADLDPDGPITVPRPLLGHAATPC
jgi:hypothetical protein